MGTVACWLRADMMMQVDRSGKVGARFGSWERERLLFIVFVSTNRREQAAS